MKSTKNTETKTDTVPEIHKELSNQVSVKTHKYALHIDRNKIQIAKQKCNKPKNSKHNIAMIAYFPYGLSDVFKDTIISTFPEYTNRIQFGGSLNKDNIIYKALEILPDVSLLPDILITTDFNSLYHKRFLNKFLNKENFETLNIQYKPLFHNAGCQHPKGLITMITADLMVMVVDKTKFIGKSLPTEWYELLNPNLKKSIVLCGNKDYFCNSIFFPFYKNYGIEAIQCLAANVINRMHPIEMMHAINSGNQLGASIYIMPYSSAMKIVGNLNYEIVWPNDGAFAIPVQLLVKKGAYSIHKALIDFITGKQFGNILESLDYPALNTISNNEFVYNKINWQGWDFIQKTDIQKLKENIQGVITQNGIGL